MVGKQGPSDGETTYHSFTESADVHEARTGRTSPLGGGQLGVSKAVGVVPVGVDGETFSPPGPSYPEVQQSVPIDGGGGLGPLSVFGNTEPAFPDTEGGMPSNVVAQLATTNNFFQPGDR